MEYRIMETTYSDHIKVLHRKIAKRMVDSTFHQAIDIGVTDYLFGVDKLCGADLIKAIKDSEIKK